MKSLFLKMLIPIILFPFFSHGQIVTNVDYQVEESSIIVIYDINGCSNGCNIILSLKSKDGKTVQASKLMGDFISVTNGNARKIRWQPLDEGIELKGDYKVVLDIISNPRHSVGEQMMGGIVYWVDNKGTHGLIADKNDLGELIWYNAIKACEQKGEGWHLPTKKELILLNASKFEIV